MSSGGSGALRPGGGGQVAFGGERRVDPVEVRPPTQKPKAYLKDANGKECESIGFIPGSAEPPAARTCDPCDPCDPCAPPRTCRTFVCGVLTCGLYRVCQRSVLAPCLAPDDGSPEEPEKASLRDAKPGDGGEDVNTPDTWNDILIAGVKVVGPGEGPDAGAEPAPYVPPARPDFGSLHESMRFGDWEDGGEDVDSLITRKLLQLYSEYQIEELARCTTDSVFLRKTGAINQLINSLAEEHQMGEREAECRLVRGIIRISTRKSKKRRPHVSRTAPSDSGNETWNGSSSPSFSNNNDYRSSPNIQISELTSSDKFARDMWRKTDGEDTSAFKPRPGNVGRRRFDPTLAFCVKNKEMGRKEEKGGPGPGSPTASSPSETEVDSSGVPLMCSSVRT